MVTSFSKAPFNHDQQLAAPRAAHRRQAGVAAAIEADTVASTEAEAETAPKPSLRPRQLLPRSERKAVGSRVPEEVAKWKVIMVLMVGGLGHFLIIFPHIGKKKNPTDFHIFQRG